MKIAFKGRAMLLAMALMLLLSGTAYANFIIQDDNGTWLECHYESWVDHTGTLRTETVCQALDHEPPLDP